MDVSLNYCIYTGNGLKAQAKVYTSAHTVF